MMCNSLIIWLFLFVTELRQSSEWSQRPEWVACMQLLLLLQAGGRFLCNPHYDWKVNSSEAAGQLHPGETQCWGGSERERRKEWMWSLLPPSDGAFEIFLPALPVGLHLQGVVGVLEDGGAWRLRYTCVANQVQLFLKKTHKKASLVFCNHENVILLYFSQSVIVLSQVLQVSFSYNCNWLVITSLQPCNSVLHFYIVCPRWRCPCSGWSFRWHQWHWAVFLSLVQIGCGEAGRPVPSSCPQAATPSD